MSIFVGREGGETYKNGSSIEVPVVLSSSCIPHRTPLPLGFTWCRSRDEGLRS